MTSPGRGSLRVVRGLILAAICLVMSLTAHVAAGGSAHMSAGLLFGGLGLSVICITAADSRGSFGGIFSVVLVSQIALHLFAGAGAHHAEPAGFGLTGQMAAYHAVAAVAVSVLLAHGDRLVWAMWSLARLPRVSVLGHPVPDGDGPVAVTFTEEPARRTGLELCLGGLTSRGPPALT